MKKQYIFTTENATDKVYWVDEVEGERIITPIGAHLFSFDKKKIYNLFADYPHNLTPQEKQIFDKENKYWADFFKHR